MDVAPRQSLLAGIVDYAGLFPPAALSMAEAVAEYAEAVAGPDAWMLGRFVVPAARLADLEQQLAATGGAARAWQLSAIVGDRSDADRAAVFAFNLRARDDATVDAIEAKPESLDGIDWLAEAFGDGFDVYVEIAAGGEAERWLQRVAAAGLRAKVRTGGLTAGAFPSPEALLQFVAAAVRLDVPFKATAGLHHAVRGEYPLTYAPDAARATMYGYLNLLLATAALGEGLPDAVAAALLQRADSSSLTLSGAGSVRWGDATVSREAIQRTRQAHLVSFGSCSFREPAGEYRGLTVPIASSAAR